MRRLVNKCAFIFAALLIMAVPVIADDLSVVPSMERAQQQSGKDECLLVAMNCGDRVESIQNRIGMIQDEINRGQTVYTNDELRILQKRLDEANRELNESAEGGV